MQKKKNPYSPVISSSEISQYLFCPLSWWYGRIGENIVTKSMKLGTKFHAKQAVKQTASRKLYIIKMIAIAVLIILFFLWLWRLIQ